MLTEETPKVWSFVISCRGGVKKFRRFKEPTWIKVDMDSDLKKALGKQKEANHYIFFNQETKTYYCFNVQRPDSWSKPRITFPFEVPLRHVSMVYSIVKNNWNKPRSPLKQDPLEIPKSCRFNRHDLVPLLIDGFGVEVGFNRFVTDKSNFNSPIYEWPLQILQALGRVRFGRCSWRLA